MLEVMETVAVAAGNVILDVYSSKLDVTFKSDLSPVTIADLRAEALIISELKRHFPQIPIVAEESGYVESCFISANGFFFLVDPLDGTKEFVDGRSDFTVNIALIENGIPVLGVVYAPARRIAYSGSRDGAEKLSISGNNSVISRRPILTRSRANQLIAVSSRSHYDARTESFLKEKKVRECRSVGSSLKFCLLAEGEADVYPRFGRTMEWDTAAGDAVLRGAGGITLNLDGSPLLYGKRGEERNADFANPSFIAWGRRRECW